MIAASRAPMGGGAVDVGDDLADLVEGERSGQASWRAAVGAAQPETDLAHDLGGDWVGGAAHAVDVPDRDAGQVQGAHRPALLGPGGQVRAQRQRVTGQGRDVAGGAARSHWPRAWE